MMLSDDMIGSIASHVLAAASIELSSTLSASESHDSLQRCDVRERARPVPWQQ